MMRKLKIKDLISLIINLVNEPFYKIKYQVINHIHILLIMGTPIKIEYISLYSIYIYYTFLYILYSPPRFLDYILNCDINDYWHIFSEQFDPFVFFGLRIGIDFWSEPICEVKEYMFNRGNTKFLSNTLFVGTYFLYS